MHPLDPSINGLDRISRFLNLGSKLDPENPKTTDIHAVERKNKRLQDVILEKLDLADGKAADERWNSLQFNPWVNIDAATIADPTLAMIEKLRHRTSYGAGLDSAFTLRVVLRNAWILWVIRYGGNPAAILPMSSEYNETVEAMATFAASSHSNSWENVLSWAEKKVKACAPPEWMSIRD